MRLARSGLLHLRGVERTEIVCAAGRLWVTEEGDSIDHFLEAGERYRVHSNGKVVVEALHDATFEILGVAAGHRIGMPCVLQPSTEAP
jgi:Protein of unknown function (DUF2917)